MKKRLGCIGLFCLMLLCCSGCTPNALQQDTEPAEYSAGDGVYVVNGSNRTTGDWGMEYGAVTANGRMVLPLDHRQITEIRDEATGEQLWLQTYEVIVKDGAAVTEEMIQDYYEGLYTDADWKYFEQQYLLYDLEGNLLENLGACGIRRVCGDFVLYQDNRLVNRQTGSLLYDDVVAINMAGDYYIIDYDQYRRVRVMDKAGQILLDAEGSDGFLAPDGSYVIVTSEDDKKGLCRLDGTQLVPCAYDYFFSYASMQTAYVQAGKDGIVHVISLEDGNVVYQAADDYEYVQYLFDDFMVIQKRMDIGTETAGYPVYKYRTQLYDYQGNPVSKAYTYLSPDTDIYGKTLAETGEGLLLFLVTDETGESAVINQNEEVIFTVPENCRAELLTGDRLIVRTEEGQSAALYTMDGQVLNEKSYESMNALYLPDRKGLYQRSDMVAGYYAFNNLYLMDVLDCDGNLIIERAKSVNMLAENRFWVEKGFSQGLMDAEGNWIYEQSLFDSAAEE